MQYSTSLCEDDAVLHVGFYPSMKLASHALIMALSPPVFTELLIMVVLCPRDDLGDGLRLAQSPVNVAQQASGKQRACNSSGTAVLSGYVRCLRALWRQRPAK